MPSFHALLAPHVTSELAAAEAARLRGDRALLWHHLERAHIVSLPSARHHTRVHWRMLVQAIRQRDVRETAGQVIRLLLGAPSSVFHSFPVGNAGSTRVGLTEKAAMPADLRQVFDDVYRMRAAS